MKGKGKKNEILCRRTSDDITQITDELHPRVIKFLRLKSDHKEEKSTNERKCDNGPQLRKL